MTIAGAWLWTRRWFGVVILIAVLLVFAFVIAETMYCGARGGPGGDCGLHRYV